jgi:hypothetical protein
VDVISDAGVAVLATNAGLRSEGLAPPRGVCEDKAKAI